MSLLRDRQLREREAAVELREKRVGGMDSDLLATFGDLPNGNSTASKKVAELCCAPHDFQRKMSPMCVKSGSMPASHLRCAST